MPVNTERTCPTNPNAIGKGRKFDGQQALITGASGAVGKAIALALAGEGCNMHLVGRRSDALQAVVKSVAAGSPNPLCYAIDLTDDEEVARLKRDLDHGLNGLDILVHCAGVISIGAIDCSSVEQFDLQYRTNLRAPYVLTKALLPLLKRASGQVVFMNSTAGLTARAAVAPYAVTKHGLRALADGLRQEVNADGVRVLTVFLGRTASEMQRTVHEFEGATYRPEHLIQPDDVASMVIAVLGLNRTAEVTDISIRPVKKTERP